MKKLIAFVLACLVLTAGVCCADETWYNIEPTYSTIMSLQSMSVLMQSARTRATCALCMMLDASSNGVLPESLFNATNSIYVAYSGDCITLCLDSDEGLFLVIYDQSDKQLSYVNYGTYSGLGESVMEEINTACYFVSASDLLDVMESLED